MSDATPPTFATFTRGPLASAVAELAPAGSLKEQLVLLLASDPDVTNRLLLGIATLGTRLLPMGTLLPTEKAAYGKHKPALLRLRRDHLCDVLRMLQGYNLPFTLTPDRLQQLGALQVSFLNWRLLGQKLINLGMDRRAVLGPLQLMMVNRLVEQVHARFKDPALTSKERHKLLDDFAPALLELERVLSTPVVRKEELKGARADAKAQLEAATVDAAYAETLLKLRQNLVVPRAELFAAARRHQELTKQEAEKAKEEQAKTPPKAPGPRRLL